LLGVFLLIAGVGLARASQCWHTKPGLLAAIVMVAVHLVTGILVLGFVAGWITCVIVAKLAPRFEQFSDAEAPRA
jgi:hypothetical protein